MELESEIPPPPYSEVDPQTPTIISESSSSMGGGDHSPTSTLRPTSSQSMRAPSFITLRGGYLRGVPFAEDSTTAMYFQERAFQFDPNRALEVLHREITADTTRDDLPYPVFDRDRDVSEQDWQTFVNYILTELGNETSSPKQHKKLQPAEFYERQTKLEQLVAEWNESFFQPRSMKFIAHYYYTHSQAPRVRQESDQPELVSGIRKINIEDGSMDVPEMANTSQVESSFAHGRGWSSPRHGPHTRGFGFFHGGPFMRGGFHTGFMPGRGHPGLNHGHNFGHRNGPFHRGRQSHDVGHDHGRHRDRSASTESSSSSSSDSDTEHHGRPRGGGRRGRREHRGERRHRRRRSRSASSDSSISSVSSISSEEMDDSAFRSVREALTSFRLDPSNPQNNKLAYRQLLQHIRNQKDQALHNRSSLPRGVHTVSKAQRKALRDELRALRRSLKNMSKQAKQATKAARDQEKAVRKQEKAIRKAAKQQEKAIRKAGKNQTKAAKRVTTSSASPRQQDLPFRVGRDLSGQSYGVTHQAQGYQMPGAFPDTPQDNFNNNYAEQANQIEAQLPVLRASLDSLHTAASKTNKHITDMEKKEQALAPIQEQIYNTEREIAELERQVAQLRQLASTPANETQRSPFVDGRTARSLSEGGIAFGNRAGNYGEQLGRRIEVWGEQFGRAMEAWGEHFGREMERRGAEFGRSIEQRGDRLGRTLSGQFSPGR